MADRTCASCKRVFRYPSDLRAHRQRKTPCAPIIDKAALSEKDRQKPHSCKFCGRRFATEVSMYRHVRMNCKIAGSEEGMDRLMEHTLQHQLAEMRSEQAEMRSEHAAQINELTALVKQLAVGQVVPAGAATQVVAHAGQVNLGAVTNVQNIIIIPWDGDRRINIDVGQVAAAFTENTRLREYARLEEHQLTDPEIAPPYVTELLVDLVKRGHADPAARNIYLNPKRADQVLVHMQSGRWEVRDLQEATRLVFDGVAKAMVRITMSNEERRKLPLDAQNALAMAGLLYDDEPEEYAKRARGPLAAHLSNTAPTQ